jgi:hypothetical protein
LSTGCDYWTEEVVNPLVAVYSLVVAVRVAVGLAFAVYIAVTIADAVCVFFALFTRFDVSVAAYIGLAFVAVTACARYVAHSILAVALAFVECIV